MNIYLFGFSLRSRRLEVVGERENRRTRGLTSSLSRVFSLAHYLQVPATQAILDCFFITLRPTSVPGFPPSILTIFTTSSSKFPQVLTVVSTNGRAGNRENDLGLRCHLYYRFHKTTTNSDKSKVSFWKSPLWWIIYLLKNPWST